MYQYLNDIQKKRIFMAVFTAVVIFSAFLAVEVLSVLKQISYIGSGVTPTNVITVTGKGEIFVIPDTGSFSFSVVEDGATVKDAQDKASKKVNSIIDALKAMGIDEKDIKTIGYYSNPKYEYSNSTCPMMSNPNGVIYPCPSGKQVLTGYEVNQTISVKVRKTDDAGTALTKVGSLGASNISGIDFVIDDMDAVNSQARDKAIQDAKDKAEVLAKSLGVKLVRIVSFNESGNYPVPYYSMGVMKADAGSSESTPPQVPVGQNQIVSNVTITYEIK